ncbi:MAG: nicotinate-nucleotide adenylyltransferase [Bacillota bacterium]|nr:nicotinate-nucleotide adenylyltransferase [Bacillota bacterium]
MSEPVTDNIGIMGGTFDPIHLGHLVTAETARQAFHLRKVIFVPAGRPPHKEGQPITEAEHRYMMTVLATVSNPDFCVDRVEIDQPGPSYSVDTVALFGERYPDSNLYFITGADAVLEICSWRNCHRLLSMCRVVAATRPGYDLAGLSRLADMVGEELFCRIVPLGVPALAISSSDLRRQVTQGRSIRYLVPRAVEEYIQKHGLYRRPRERRAAAGWGMVHIDGPILSGKAGEEDA